MIIMGNVMVKQITDDIQFGLRDLMRVATRGEYNRLFARPEHHLSAGTLMISIALVIAIARI